MALTQVPSVMIDRPLVTIASASTVAIGASASENISVTGTTTITAFDTVAAGAVRSVTFAGILTLTHNATSLILPGSANITTAAGDVGTFMSLGTGNWRCVNYTKASGQAVIAPASAFAGVGGQVFTTSGTFTVPVGVTAIKVSLCGGGGTGGGGGGGYYGGGGGGAGVAIKYITGLTPLSTVAVTVGGISGTSSFGAYCSATGGALGGTYVACSRHGYAGTGGTGTGGDMNFSAASLANTGGVTGTAAGGNYSSGSSIGMLGGATGSQGAAVNATGYGNGGSGGGSGGTAAGTGSPGVVIVEY